ncbi:MAG TPA: methylated-DNA--[protein]-cysteine S-methyltransferase [Solirubrobacterales bacterium]
MEIGWTVHESPIGPLTAIAAESGLRSLHFPGRSPRLDEGGRIPMRRLSAQLDRYFAGELRAFDVELDLRGGPLQRIVWGLLVEIPYGQTTSYGELAELIDPSAYPAGFEPYERARLVGAAVGRTPTPIIVPCHRVIGADGSLTGYGGGLHRKQALLDLERRASSGVEPDPIWSTRQQALL